jgi:two-component system, cell cycle sensor histidine kinase and response regulator CckA
MTSPPIVLVIDDQPDALSLVGQVLARDGYQVRTASDGQGGLASALEHRPDLILLDVRLGDMDGLEVCRRLKSHEDTKDTPVILMSGAADVDEWVRGLGVGAVDYVNKPFHIVELLARVRTQLSLGRTLEMLKEEHAIIESVNRQLQSEVVARQTVELQLRRSLERADRARLALLNALEDEKRAEAELQKANAFLDSIIENIPDMVLITEAQELRIVRINRAGERLLGVARRELLGRTAQEVFTRPQGDLLTAVDRKVLSTCDSVEVPDEPIETTGGVRVLHTKKVPIIGSDGQPTHVLGISVDVTEARRAQDAIVALSSRLRDILGTVPEILTEVDIDWVYTWGNAASLKFFGDEFVGQPATHFLVGGPAGADARPLLDGREDASYFENEQRRKDGARRLLAWWCRPLKDARGKVRGALLSARDITESRKADEEKRRLEEQVRASQRMEAIGSLAGGVAHDFNNLLCVLQSYTEFALRGIRADDPVKDDLLAVKRAGERAATLTRQLLAFGRKQVLQPVPVNLNDIVAGIEKMLRRILGEDIDFTLALASDLGVVRADRGQIEEVLVNLAANARDAMLDGGKLTIETCNVEIDDKFTDIQAPMAPGPYVQIAVSDTGCGMDEHTMARIFDPFFTTKERGKGTGLGLSTVYGIVKQSRGGLWVSSEIGKGSTFKIHLPRDLHALPAAAATTENESHGGGHETVLLVEDEEDLRHVARRALEAAGYTVLVAADGQQALDAMAQYPGEIQLLLTDVVMPNLGGRALAQRLRQVRPGVIVLYMSGYTDDAILRHGLFDAEVQLLAKPFTATALTHKVREVLDRAAGGASGRVRHVVLPERTPEPVVRARRLSALPEALVVRLRRALAAARYEDIVLIVEEIVLIDPPVAELLRQHLEGFDYQTIAKLLDGQTRGGNAS